MQADPKIYPLLSKIDSPSELRQLSQNELNKLAAELRDFLIQSLNICGGHFAANLGTIELTIALHYVFNTPKDQIIWDVGHQAYPHKILTGRRDQIATVKQAAGLAPFPKRSESEYDAFGTGHSSTSISAALGMAIASEANRQVVAVIGDGGLTGGMAFEALNHAGSIDANLLVILNDNDMSISPNVGALNNYLVRIMSGKAYTSFREGSKKVLEKMGPMKTFVKRTETHVKGMITPGTIFEELGFHYFGPIDGHDLAALLPTLENLSQLKGPRFLHIITKKGKGFAAAEADPVKYHAVKSGFLNATAAKSTATKTANPTYSEVFGKFLCDLAPIEKNLMAITPAMCEGSGMQQFAQQFPEKYFDVGIAEQHSVTLAAGMACAGKKPIVAIYSSFLQRAYDQLIHDVAIQNLDVTFAIDRAGLVGADGPTHAGSFDLSYLRCIPNMLIMAPSDANEARQMLYTGFQFKGPATIRYPRGSGPQVIIEEKFEAISIGKAKLKRLGEQIAILAFGSMLQPALAASETINATVVDMRFVKPLDQDLILQLTDTHTLLVTVEENAIMGGAGSAVNEFLNQQNQKISILNLGLPDEFIEHNDHEKMLADCGLDSGGILNAIKNFKKKTILVSS